MLSFISKAILKILGWKFEGRYPYEIKKLVVIVIPHTSSWDFPLGVLVRSALNADIKYVAKHTLFRFPLNYILKWLGGYPVDRSRKNNFVDAVIDIYDKKESFAIQIAPEGTRKRVDKLKTGFYYIAKGAKIPIVMVGFDYGTKTLKISAPFYPTDNMEADFAHIDAFYKGIRGFYPEKSYKYSS